MATLYDNQAYSCYDCALFLTATALNLFGLKTQRSILDDNHGLFTCLSFYVVVDLFSSQYLGYFPA
jgi:hypothetical protein